jgi:hypothetical protein
MLRFAAPRRPNPFDNPLVSVAAHLLSSIAISVGVYFLLASGSFIPLIGAAVAVTALEGEWLYFLLHR